MGDGNEGKHRRASPDRPRSPSKPSAAPRATRLAKRAGSPESNGGDMEAARTTRKRAFKKLVAAAAAGLLVAVAGSTPPAVASSSETDRVVSYRTIDRAELENLQRWVSAGHEDWCRDPRLVAAEELKRTAPEGGIEGPALNAVEVERVANDAKKITYAWAPLEGRQLYRVTVERFDWLLPIAKDPESVVWVPTAVEIRVLD
jgi:hypothetical protein